MLRAASLPMLDPATGLSPAEQIAAHYRGAVASGTLAPGDRLPPIRAVAEALGLTRAVVQSAYRQLVEDKVVRATVGRGTEVLGTAGAAPVRAPIARVALQAMHVLERAPCQPQADPSDELIADFGSLAPDPATMPVDEIADALRSALREDGAQLLGYGDPAGHEGLRAALAARHVDRGLGDRSRVLVTSGAQQGIDLVLRSLTDPGDAVAVALPTYPQLFGALAAHDLQLVPVPMRGAALDLDALREVLPRVRLVYVMPTFHNPTGLTMDLPARRALMDALGDSDVWLCEDEVECELRIDGEDLPTLQSLDVRDRTVVVRSFSKGLFPGVRLGWIEAAPEWIAPMAALKRFADIECSPLLQAALLRLIDSGILDRNLATLRDQLREKHRVMQAALQRWMPESVRWTTPDGGLSMWVELPSHVDARELARAAARNGVIATPGDIFLPRPHSSNGLRLALSRVSLAAIDAGVRVLAEHVREATSPSAPIRSVPLLL
jgi:DNA-binding transcriptional MocR family regulator